MEDNMKKICCAILIASQLLGASAAFAGRLAAGILSPGQIILADNGKTKGTDADYYELPAFAKLSTGVTLAYDTGTSSYAIETKHVNGDKQFGAAANDGKNYVQDAAVGTSANNGTALGNSDSSSFPLTGGWSAL
jgi:hypothetical protein